MKILIVAAGLLICLSAVVPPSLSHCEIPCGIYDDEARLAQIEEHITTIEKSMSMIVELSKESEKNYNQLVRWVDNKETHANGVQGIVCQYFMTQRVKPAAVPDSPDHHKYVERLILLHRMLIHAMKAKQTTDLEHVNTLRSLVQEFRRAYLIPGKSQHSHH